MLAFAYYILKVILCSAVLFGYYWFFLRNKIWHVYNRFYLLAVIVLSLTLPLLKFNIWQKADEPKTNAIQILQFVNSSDDYMTDIVIQSPAAKHFTMSTAQIAICIFAFVSFIFTILLIRSLYKIYTLKKNNPTQLYEDISLVNTSDKSTPFSFLKNIFWNNAIDINSTNGSRILKHEIAHVQQKHSEDKLFINIVLLVFWCNPIFWLLRKELNLIHEFLADKKAVEDGDTAAFAAMILQTTYPAHQFEIANNFFYSPIKRRLAMLTKNNKTKVNYISRLLVLPLAVLVFAAFSLKAKTYHHADLPKGKIFTVVIDAGHGGTDNGAMASDGTTEKDINLQLIKKIKALNDNDQIKIVLTRDADIYQSPQEKATFVNKQNADLLLSIHCDAGPQKISQRSLMSVWTCPKQNNPKSILLASSVISAFQTKYGIEVDDEPMQRQVGIWLLSEANCPAALIEAGFITNLHDLSYLKSDEGQTQFAKNVLAAMQNYVSNKSVTKNSELFEDEPETKSAKDTVPENRLQVSMVGNVKMDVDNAGNTSEKGLIIISGKEYTQAQLQGKEVNGKHARFYQKGNAEMIKKYGDKASGGVMIIENGTIKNSPDKQSRMNISVDSADIETYKVSEDKTKNVFENNLSIGKHPLYIVDGIIKDDIKGIDPNIIKAVNVLKGEKAINKYGAKGQDGAVEVTLKKDPAITLSGMRGPNISLSKLKEIKELTLSDPDYKILTAAVYFSGNGFEKVKVAQINSGSLQVLQSDLNLIVNGSVLTFDNVRVTKSDGSGIRTIDGRSYSFNEMANGGTGKVFSAVETPAQFPGGQAALRKYLSENLDVKVPVTEHWKAGVYTLKMNFVVDEHGKLKDIKTDDFADSKTAQMCINLLKKGPDWIPAIQNEHIVAAYTKQPISFTVAN